MTKQQAQELELYLQEVAGLEEDTTDMFILGLSNDVWEKADEYALLGTAGMGCLSDFASVIPLAETGYDFIIDGNYEENNKDDGSFVSGYLKFFLRDKETGETFGADRKYTDMREREFVYVLPNRNDISVLVVLDGEEG